jgi:hypothetical protein
MNKIQAEKLQEMVIISLSWAADYIMQLEPKDVTAHVEMNKYTTWLKKQLL